MATSSTHHLWLTIKEVGLLSEDHLPQSRLDQSKSNLHNFKGSMFHLVVHHSLRGGAYATFPMVCHEFQKVFVMIAATQHDDS